VIAGAWLSHRRDRRACSASDAHAKYIITDRFARVAKGDSPKSSIARAEWELKKVYEQA
jgi:hypothetical protein